MRLTQQLALVPLTVISLLVFIAHGIPREGSATDTLALSGRDDTANYTVYPKDTQNEDQAAAIYNLLIGVVSDPTTIFNSTTDHGTQHWFWGLPLTSAHAEKVKGNSNVTIRSCSSSNWALIDQTRLLQLFKNAHRIVLIQQQAMTRQAPSQGNQMIAPTT